MRILITAISLGGLLAATGCEPDPTRPNQDDQAACEAAGGRYSQGGIFAEYMCFMTPPDAGATCSAPSDCSTSTCLVSDYGDTVGSCASVSPMFGCYVYLEEDGEVVEICVD